MNKNLRFYYNSNIVNKLSELVTRFPQLRFHQILWSCGIFETDKNGQILDKFYEEPDCTWNNMLETQIVKELNNEVN